MKISSFLAATLITFAANAYSQNDVGSAVGFPYAGQYQADNSNLSISIDANRHIELSPVSWSYSRPLIKDDELSFHATGNFPSGGCSVPVESTFDFSSSGDAIDVEFSKPNTVLRGPFGGCSFFGNQIFRYHFVKVGSNPNQSWTRNIQGQGCGAWGAGQSVNNQISSLAQQCAQQGGAASSSSRMPSCGPVDPNDLSCPSGICTVSAQFNCAL